MVVRLFHAGFFFDCFPYLISNCIKNNNVTMRLVAGKREFQLIHTSAWRCAFLLIGGFCLQRKGSLYIHKRGRRMSKNSVKSDSMEQVRELLLGTQMKDMENRLQRLDARFQRTITDLGDSLRNRMESLESFMKSESASFLHRMQEEQAERSAALKSEQRERLETLRAEKNERLEAFKNEQRERNEALSQVARDLGALTEDMERKLKALSGTLDTAERELRQLLLSENARLSDKIEQKYKDALAVLSNTAAQVRHDMASRSQVSSLLTEMALKLSGQWSTADPVPSEALEHFEEMDQEEAEHSE